ncbi:MAG: polysaccharide deacetylase family protein [Synoicihabitans sp.]
MPSDQPPGGLSPHKVPMFIMIGFDDNPHVEPMSWILDYALELKNPAGVGQHETFDGKPVRFAFYSNGTYLDKSAELAALHYRAWLSGHEVTNHTHNHLQGGEFTKQQWLAEMDLCRRSLLECGIVNEAQNGFRTPFLAYNDATFSAAQEMGFVYDTSIEEGYQADHDGTNFLWPYTLDEGSPGNRVITKPDSIKRVSSHPGLWEIPLHVLIVPPDERSADFDLRPGLTQRIEDFVKANGNWNWSREARKISGLDWNVFEAAGCNGPEFLAILKHTLELRLAGNRAPLMVGAHTALFPAHLPDRREALEAFIAHALRHPEVRFVTPMQLIRWLKNPVALGQ